MVGPREVYGNDQGCVPTQHAQQASPTETKFHTQMPVRGRGLSEEKNSGNQRLLSMSCSHRSGASALCGCEEQQC